MVSRWLCSFAAVFNGAVSLMVVDGLWGEVPLSGVSGSALVLGVGLTVASFGTPLLLLRRAA